MKLTRIRPSVVVAAILAVGVVVWLGSGQLEQPPGSGTAPQAEPRSEGEVASGETSGAATASGRAPVQVRTILSTSEPFLAELVVTGRTQANRRVTLRAETDGAVVEVMGVEGAEIAAGAAVARLAMEDREAVRAQAGSLVAQREIEVNAARRLADRGFQSQTRLAEAEANLAAARAALEHARIDIARTALAAPFDGILADRLVELGDYVKAGDAVAEIVDLNPILIVAQISEREIGSLSTGTVGRARLITEEELDGVVTLIAPSANDATRTFRLEMEVDNTDGAIRDGITAELRLPRNRIMAHRIPPSLLVLDDGGRIGVKSVDAEARAHFQPVEIVGDTSEAIWVTGLPDTVTLISVGQVYVSPGEIVDARPQNTDASRAGENG